MSQHQRLGILPSLKRGPPVKNDNYYPSEISERINELISRFFTSQGLPYNAIEDSSFVQLIEIISHGDIKNLPTPSIIESCVKSIANKNTHSASKKAVGPLTATVDVVTHDDQLFILFSIHFFNKLGGRKCVVHLKKMQFCVIDGQGIMTAIRKTIDCFNYGNIRFINLVSSDNAIATKLYETGTIDNLYICFFTYITYFVEDVLSIAEFQLGLTQLRGFVTFIKCHADLYAKFRRIQLSKHGELTLPAMDSTDWMSTVTFLSSCLSLHSTFSEFAARFHMRSYISNKTFGQLSFLERFLLFLLRFIDKLANEESSISQVIPSLTAINSFLKTKSHLHTDLSNKMNVLFGKHFEEFLVVDKTLRRYKYACFLDPRFGWRESIFKTVQWKLLSLDLLQTLQTDITIFSNMKSVQVELELYRVIVTLHRPTTDPFEWWSARRAEMPFLFHKAREFLAPPAVTISTEPYFGRVGKYNRMAATMSNEQLDEALTVATQHKGFVGRGATQQQSMTGGKEINKVERQHSPPIQDVLVNSKQTLERYCRDSAKSPRIIVQKPADYTKMKKESEKDVAQPLKINGIAGEERMMTCNLCCQIFNKSTMICVDNFFDELFLYTDLILDKQLSMNEGKFRINARKKSIICQEHLCRSGYGLLKRLRVKKLGDIFNVNGMISKETMNVVEQLSETKWTALDLKKCLIVFIDKFHGEENEEEEEIEEASSIYEDQEEITFDTVFNDADQEAMEMINNNNNNNNISTMCTLMARPDEETSIAPKKRAPRKQVLVEEEDQQQELEVKMEDQSDDQNDIIV